MKPLEADPCERRLRLLLAREFASRGYWLDAESLYQGSRTGTMSAAEMELLACVAAQRGDWSRTEKRFESLAEICSDPEQRSRARELAAYAREQLMKPAAAASRTKGHVRLWWLFVLALLTGAATATLLLWALGMLAVPLK